MLQAIKGYACLLLTDNNESISLFYELTADKDKLAAWQEWMERLAQKHPSCPVAQYLKGDALARLEQWEEAVAAFNAAIAQDSTYFPAYNARGVALCALGKWAEGKKAWKRRWNCPEYIS